jgi:hypothetical protein
MDLIASQGPCVNLAIRRLPIAESIVGPIKDGYCQCLGQASHTRPTGPRDCRVILDGAPTVYCVHSSCREAVAAANRELRRAIGLAERGNAPSPAPWRPSPEDQRRQQERLAREALVQRAADSLPVILRYYALDPAELWESSPIRLTSDPAYDWRLLLSALYEPDAVVWSGPATASGERYRDHWQTAGAWLNRSEPPPDPLISPAVWRPGCFQRTAANVLASPFIVVESDSLGLDAQCAVANWLKQSLRLRAAIFSGRRSVHFWFDRPAPAVLNELQTMAPAMQLDPSTLRPAALSRLPGCVRPETGQTQALLFLDSTN